MSNIETSLIKKYRQLFGLGSFGDTGNGTLNTILNGHICVTSNINTPSNRIYNN